MQQWYHKDQWHYKKILWERSFREEIEFINILVS